MKKRILAGLGVASVVGCAVTGPDVPGGGSASAPPTAGAESAAASWPSPADRIAAFDAVLADGHVTDRTTLSVVGDATTPDYRVRARLKADAVGRASAPSVDWYVKTGAPVHTTPATFSAWSAKAASDFMAFAVDGTSATRGLLLNQVNADNNTATSQSALIVVTNLYAGAGSKPDLKGYVPVATLGTSEHFGLSGLVLSPDGTQVFALSATGKLFCFTVGAGAMNACAGSWPYDAVAQSGQSGSTVTYSSPFPLYNFPASSVKSLYFGDDTGYLHCVQGSGTSAGKACWAPAQLFSPYTAGVFVGQPVVNTDPSNVTTVLVGDDKGRFYRVVDKGSTPVVGATSGSRIQETDLCGGAPNSCGALWGVRGAPAIDYSGSYVYVTANGSMFQLPLSLSQDGGNWGPDAASRTLFAVNAATEASTILDYTNKYAYVTLHNSVYKTKLPFTGSWPGATTANTYSTALQNSVAGADNFPRGWAVPYYNSLYIGTGTNAGSSATGLIEQYGCIAAAAAPPLEAVTKAASNPPPYGGLIETGEILDWSLGNLYFGVDNASTGTGGGVVQYPAGNPDPAAAWACPTGTSSVTAACGGTTCTGGCTGGPGVQGTCVNGPNVTAETCSAGTSGTCSITTCAAGFLDCDGVVANGCEVKSAVDPNNCNACGNVCPSANGTATCSGGVCSLTCNAGYAQCSPGVCSVNAGTCSNCCGHTCAGGQSCDTTAGTCVSTPTTVCPNGGTVVQGSSATVTCPSGAVIEAIQFASYGTPAGSCGSFSAGTCDDDDRGGTWSAGSTFAGNDNERKIASDLCIGKSSCTVYASDTYVQDGTTLGSPCVGTRTSLALQVGCACPGTGLPAECANGVQDGTETDVDCGGTCSTKCANGSKCEASADCASGNCNGGVCGKPCLSAGMCNSNNCTIATGACQQSGMGGRCAVNADCTTDKCDATGYCHPACADGCANLAACQVGTDCGSGVCDATNHCAAQSCAATASKCPDGNACGANSDCASNVCTNSVCAQLACETAAPFCSDGSHCDSNADCASGSCSNALCIPPACAASCAVGQTCGANADCSSNVCMLNAAGTGSVCMLAPVGGKCASSADCNTGNCNTGTSKCVANAVATGSCAVDADCATPSGLLQDCFCASSPGGCATGGPDGQHGTAVTGSCKAGRAVNASMTVPAGCSMVFVEIWAGGGGGGKGGAGGGGGYANGTFGLTTQPLVKNDRLNVNTVAGGSSTTGALVGGGGGYQAGGACQADAAGRACGSGAGTGAVFCGPGSSCYGGGAAAALVVGGGGGASGFVAGGAGGGSAAGAGLAPNSSCTGGGAGNNGVQGAAGTPGNAIGGGGTVGNGGAGSTTAGNRGGGGGGAGHYAGGGGGSLESSLCEGSGGGAATVAEFSANGFTLGANNMATGATPSVPAVSKWDYVAGVGVGGAQGPSGGNGGAGLVVLRCE